MFPLQVFLHLIYCLLLRQGAPKWVLYKNCPHRSCPLHRVDLETIFLESLGKMSCRKLVTAALDWSCLSSFWNDHRDLREIIFTGTNMYYLVYSLRFIQENFLNIGEKSEKIKHFSLVFHIILLAFY